MAAYHQMGHDSWNLVTQPDLAGFAGLILSPRHADPGTTKQRLESLGERRDDLKVLLDPQYYNPRGVRGSLPKWPYFTVDLETIDLSNLIWWENQCRAVVEIGRELGVTGVCSPAMYPRTFSDEYYGLCADIGTRMFEETEKHGMTCYLTAIVGLPDVATNGMSDRIASVLTSCPAPNVYLIFSDDLPPRTQRTDVDALIGAVRLITLLEQAGIKVLVGYSGLDLYLWKAAGATDAATGKFLNLRRFSPTAFSPDQEEGGRQLPYWTESSLITWLAEGDLRMLLRAGLYDSGAALACPFSQAILEKIKSPTHLPWTADSWSQYMRWFRNTEQQLAADPQSAADVLLMADEAWRKVEQLRIMFYDRNNTGDWIRAWLNALTFAKGA